MSTKKLGRPTECKKEHDLKVRVTPELHERIVEYSERNGITKAETVRKAVDSFLTPKK